MLLLKLEGLFVGSRRIEDRTMEVQIVRTTQVRKRAEKAVKLWKLVKGAGKRSWYCEV